LISRSEIEIIRKEIGLHEAPLLSMYIDVDPSKRENARKGWLVRAKNTLKDLHIPKPIETAVYGILDASRPEGKTYIVFAAEKDKRPWVKDFTFKVELPVVDLAHGRVEARWGEPYIAPLIYALDEYERYGVVFLNKERWRLFEAFLGEIEEVMDAFNEISREDWRRISADSPSMRYSGPKPSSSRAGAAVDRYARKMDAWAQRFYKNVARLTEKFVSEHDITRLILLGIPEETHFFEQYLPRPLRDKVVAHLASLPTPQASPREVAEKIFPEIEKIERQKELELVDRIREQPGLWGLGPVLESLQLGRLHVIAVPWELKTMVWKCTDSGLVFADEATADELCHDKKEEVELRDIIVELASSYGTRVEFVRGRAADVLLREMGGIAGLARW